MNIRTTKAGATIKLTKREQQVLEEAKGILDALARQQIDIGNIVVAGADAVAKVAKHFAEQQGK